jgi:hypothetical protein
MSSPFFRMSFWEVHRLAYGEWLPTASSMTEDEFKDHIQQLADALRTCGADKFLIDCTKGHFLMTIDIQEWHDEVIAPQYTEIGIQKIAFIVTEIDFYNRVAIELTFDETQAKKLQTRFFDEPELAWAFMMV